ncbi:MAG TPA: sn-glycerol-3-phosphate ABC transporter ATP-binding protein UgpC [Abditibacteriaceae bacterium]|nr:sn-glycerol-3-phosphate ABC transporter ATP-binding protein UgpC [Abditibacteriaceae bacterium]
MANVTLHNLNKRFPDPATKQEVAAVKDLNLEIRDGEFLVLVGPSGCGKTTALRMIAGLEDVTSGEIRIGDRVVNDAPPGDRNIAMVFHNYALYPHMSVYDNMAFGLKLRQLSSPLKQLTQMAETRRVRQDIDRNIQEAAELLDIKHLLNRKPKALSGGQRQRVALGRAIVRHPQVFLMDEPLSNLDAQLRVQTRAELIKLHRKLGVTTVYVTHDQVEAMTMGQRIAVMKGGILQQCDAPLKLYHNPVNMFVAGFLGTPSMNFVRAKVNSADNDGAVIDAGSFQLRIPAARSGALANYQGKEVVLGIRPEDIHDKSLAAYNGDKSSQASMQVDVVEAMGATSLVYLTVGEHTLIANVDAETGAREGTPLDVFLDGNAAHIFDVETEQTIV